MCRLRNCGLLTALLAALLAAWTHSNIRTHTEESQVLLTTSERLAEFGYQSEEHEVSTADGYILQLVRITASPKWEAGKRPAPQAVVLFGHGLICSADTWVILGPDYMLPYMMADAGFDVWLGNFRGNRYSSRHESLSPADSAFWRFSLDELGGYDLPAMMDYALAVARQKDLHFVCQSIGCTALFAGVSLRPEYNSKLRTAQCLAPVAYMRASRMPLRQWDLFGFAHRSPIGQLLHHRALMSHGGFWNWLCHKACQEDSPLVSVCRTILSSWGGRWNISMEIVPQLCATHPSGSSSTLLAHLMQLRHSGLFHGYVNDSAAPFRPVDMSRLSSPVHIYYGPADHVSMPPDNEALAALLPQASMYRVPRETFTHYDFMLSKDVRPLVFEPLMKEVQRYEEDRRQKERDQRRREGGGVWHRSEP